MPALPVVVQLEPMGHIATRLQEQLDWAKKFQADFNQIELTCINLGYDGYQAFVESYNAFLAATRPQATCKLPGVPDAQRYTSWLLTPAQMDALRAKAKLVGMSQNQFIGHQIGVLGETGIKTFPRHSLGRGQGRRLVKLRLDASTIERMNGLVATGVVETKQAIIDACIGEIKANPAKVARLGPALTPAEHKLVVLAQQHASKQQIVIQGLPNLTEEDLPAHEPYGAGRQPISLRLPPATNQAFLDTCKRLNTSQGRVLAGCANVIIRTPKPL